MVKAENTIMQTTEAVAEVLAQVLKRHHIHHVFGVPGSGSIDVIDALSRPEPLGRPDPNPPIMRPCFYLNRLRT